MCVSFGPFVCVLHEMSPNYLSYDVVIFSQGIVCLDILQDQWTPALNVGKVLLSLILLLQCANPGK